MTTLEEPGLWYDEETQCIVDVSNITHLFEEIRRTRVYKKDVTGEWCSDIGYSNMMDPADVGTALDNYFEGHHPGIARRDRRLPRQTAQLTPTRHRGRTCGRHHARKDHHD